MGRDRQVWGGDPDRDPWRQRSCHCRVLAGLCAWSRVLKVRHTAACALRVTARLCRVASVIDVGVVALRIPNATPVGRSNVGNDVALVEVPNIDVDSDFEDVLQGTSSEGHMPKNRRGVGFVEGGYPELARESNIAPVQPNPVSMPVPIHRTMMPSKRPLMPRCAAYNEERASMSANPRRLRPSQPLGSAAAGASAAKPMPQMLSMGDASTNTRSRVERK